MSDTNQEVRNKAREILAGLSDEEQTLLRRVVDAERQKIYMKTAHGIYDDIREVIEIVIQ